MTKREGLLLAASCSPWRRVRHPGLAWRRLVACPAVSVVVVVAALPWRLWFRSHDLPAKRHRASDSRRRSTVRSTRCGSPGSCSSTPGSGRDPVRLPHRPGGGVHPGASAAAPPSSRASSYSCSSEGRGGRTPTRRCRSRRGVRQPARPLHGRDIVLAAVDRPCCSHPSGADGGGRRMTRRCAARVGGNRRRSARRIPLAVAAERARFPSTNDCVRRATPGDGALDLVFGHRDTLAEAEQLLERVRGVGYTDAVLPGTAADGGR